MRRTRCCWKPTPTPWAQWWLKVKANGRLRVTNLGGMRAENGETENVRVYTRAGKVIEGTLQLCNASIHVNTEYGDTKRDFNTTEVVLDEDVKAAAGYA